MKEKSIKKAITLVSILIPIVVTTLLFLPNSARVSIGSSSMPLFHAVLNGTTGFFLLLGLYFIKNKQIKTHKQFMLGAFLFSCVFLVSYVVYHYSYPPTSFGGEGAIKYVYYFILISHIVLATTIIPLALFTLFRGLINDVAKHKKIAKITLPLWLYVAITGVAVYLFMMPYYNV